MMVVIVAMLVGGCGPQTRRDLTVAQYNQCMQMQREANSVDPFVALMQGSVPTREMYA